MLRPALLPWSLLILLKKAASYPHRDAGRRRSALLGLFRHYYRSLSTGDAASYRDPLAPFFPCSLDARDAKLSMEDFTKLNMEDFTEFVDG